MHWSDFSLVPLEGQFFVTSCKRISYKQILLYVTCTSFIIGSISMDNINDYNYLPFHFIDLNCTGSEESIFNCPSNALTTQYTCRYYHTAAVACHGIAWLIIVVSYY